MSKTWLDGMIQPRRREVLTKPVEPAEGPAVDLPAARERDDQVPVVFWVPIVCPCGSRDNRCYKTYGRTRYHTCRACGAKFHSVEYLPQHGRR